MEMGYILFVGQRKLLHFTSFFMLNGLGSSNDLPFFQFDDPALEESFCIVLSKLIQLN